MTSTKTTKGEVVCLSKPERRFLRNIQSSRHATARQGRRARVLELLGDSIPQVDVVKATGASIASVGRIRRRYLNDSIKGAVLGYCAPGRARKLNKKQETRIVATACTDPPLGRSSWTCELLVQRTIADDVITSIGRETIRLVLKRNGLKPWRQKMWCVPELDDRYVYRMENLLKLYARPYNPQYPVFCLDEKPTQLLGDSRVSRRSAHAVYRQDYEYIRKGTANIFCCVEPKTGKYLVNVRQHRKSLDFAMVMRNLAGLYPGAKRIHCVLDNLSTHNEKSLIGAFGSQEGKKLWRRFKVHYTPTHASWLNQAEIGIGVLTRQALRGRRFPSLQNLQDQMKSWRRAANYKMHPIVWHYTVEDARKTFSYRPIKIKRARH